MRRLSHTFDNSLLGDDLLSSCVAAWVHNLFVGTKLKRLDHRAARLLDRIDLTTSCLEALGLTLGKDPKPEGVIKQLRAHFKRAGRGPRSPVPPESVAKNLTVLQNVVGLSGCEVDVLFFLVALRHVTSLSEFVETFDAQLPEPRARLVAAALDAPVPAVRAAMSTVSRLHLSGLVDLGERHSTLTGLELKDGLNELLLTPDLEPGRLLTRYFPEDRASSLAWEDFAHLGDAPQLVASLLEAAVAQRRPGVNILFYGATGTGKTELSRLVAQRAQLRLHPAGRADRNGDSPSPQERLSSLLLGQRLLRDAQAVLLFDELEDLFNFHTNSPLNRPRASMSKQWFNELLDTNPLPTLWVSNSIHGIDPAFLRRFTYAVEFKAPGARQRGRVLERHLGETKLPANDVAALAERFDVSAAQVSAAVAASRLLRPEPDRATLEQFLAPSEKLLGGDRPQKPVAFDVRSYRLDVTHTREDLASLVDALADWRPDERPGVSLCLYGPPGTGKSEFARYLAHRMGRRVVYRRVSDLQSMWVGECEKNIAAAFREAEQDDALLLFDEADTFLRDRAGAQQSWEASQVNEFLQQLEHFRGVVACTTNLWRELDAASLRRFVFKVEFRPLRADQAARLFESFLADVLCEPVTDQRALERQLAPLTLLTPGDYAATRRRLLATRQRVRIEEAVELLRAEVALKKGSARPVGFLNG